MKNLDYEVVESFGFEWRKFNFNKINEEYLSKIFQQYFLIFPFNLINNQSVGADFGCGTGRWAKFLVDKVAKIYCIDASDEALLSAKENLKKYENVEFIHSTINDLVIENNSLDFAYSLGVLHHIPDTVSALRVINKKLKNGAPFLIYLYYSPQDMNLLNRIVFKFVDFSRKIISKLPIIFRYFITQIIAVAIYFPISKFSSIVQKVIKKKVNLPLSYYSDLPFYIMRNDAYDRFATKIEKRFSKSQITEMLIQAGFSNIVFSEQAPYWCCVSQKIESSE